MLFLYELHDVIGRRDEEFEGVVRDELMPTLAKGDDARLLWFLNLTVGRFFSVVTITAIRDGGAYERLARSTQRGELRDLERRLDLLRHRVTEKLLLPVDWSPLQDVDFDDVASDGRDHEPTLYFESSGFPYAGGDLDAFIAAIGDTFWYPVVEQARGGETPLLMPEACFQVALGSRARPEVIVWDKLADGAELAATWGSGFTPEQRAPGMPLHELLKHRDDCETKILRTSRWSPLY